MRRAVKTLSLYIIGFLGIGAASSYLLDGFSISRVLKTSCIAKGQEESPPENLLQQTYTYLGKGKQAHVFLSEDKTHVLKLFHPPVPSTTLSLLGKTFTLRCSKLPFFPELYTICCKERSLLSLERDFLSYKNAFRLLKEDSALSYLHLETTRHLRTSLRIIDPIGIPYELDADTTSFLLQKKMNPLYETLSDCLLQKDEQKAKELLDSYVAMAFTFVEKGIVKPSTIEPNWGCIDSKACLLDVGRVLTFENIKGEHPPTENQIYHTTHHLQKWLAERSPLLESYLKESIQNHLQGLSHEL